MLSGQSRFIRPAIFLNDLIQQQLSFSRFCFDCVRHRRAGSHRPSLPRLSLPRLQSVEHGLILRFQRGFSLVCERGRSGDLPGGGCAVPFRLWRVLSALLLASLRRRLSRHILTRFAPSGIPRSPGSGWPIHFAAK